MDSEYVGVACISEQGMELLGQALLFDVLG